MNQRELFLRHVAQTSNAPLALEIARAEGVYLFDTSGKRYLDLIGGISVCNTGHRHPHVVEAIRNQADQYLHVLVYGEYVLTPQVQYARMLAEHLPASLDAVYFTNSGAEAVEGAMKLAKRATGRAEIVAFDQSYHGSTQGALSVMGDEYWRNAFRPLLPAVRHLAYNDRDSLKAITTATACVIAETIQAENGVRSPDHEWMQALRRRCTEVGALMILDEIQVGFGRTGTLWGFEAYDVVPDVLLLGKALGGGLPLGAFIAGGETMRLLTEKPVLGHITTFGGHPLCCAAGMAAFEVLLNERLTETVNRKAQLFKDRLQHRDIVAVRSAGLLLALEFRNEQINRAVIDHCVRSGVVTDWFLFAPHCLRIAPPLTISSEEIEYACDVILEAIGDFRF